MQTTFVSSLTTCSGATLRRTRPRAGSTLQGACPLSSYGRNIRSGADGVGHRAASSSATSQYVCTPPAKNLISSPAWSRGRAQISTEHGRQLCTKVFGTSFTCTGTTSIPFTCAKQAAFTQTFCLQQDNACRHRKASFGRFAYVQSFRNDVQSLFRPSPTLLNISAFRKAEKENQYCLQQQYVYPCSASKTFKIKLNELWFILSNTSGADLGLNWIFFLPNFFPHPTTFKVPVKFARGET